MAHKVKLHEYLRGNPRYMQAAQNYRLMSKHIKGEQRKNHMEPHYARIIESEIGFILNYQKGIFLSVLRRVKKEYNRKFK